MELKPIRLIPDEAQGWLWWPSWQARVEKFIAKYLTEPDLKPVIYDIRKRWFDAPNLTQYWLLLADDKPVGHMVAWIYMNYGTPKVFIYQAEVDEGYSGQSIVNDVLGALDVWVKDLNSKIPEGGKKIEKAELSTWRSDKAWVKYLEKTGHSSVKVRSVIEFNVGV